MGGGGVGWLDQVGIKPTQPHLSWSLGRAWQQTKMGGRISTKNQKVQKGKGSRVMGQELRDKG